MSTAESDRLGQRELLTRGQGDETPPRSSPRASRRR